MLLQVLNANQLAQWDGIVTSLETLEIQHVTGLKALIRSGIPYHHRVSSSHQIYLIFYVDIVINLY
jgi:hypothetical protein